MIIEYMEEDHAENLDKSAVFFHSAFWDGVWFPSSNENGRLFSILLLERWSATA
jgi:hypothetical protein